MNRRLRTRHRRAVLAMALALPIGMSAAIAARVNELDTEDTPAFVAGPARPAGDSVDLSGAWQSVAIETLLWRETPQGATLELRPVTDLLAPDVLLYWNASASDEVSDTSVQLGRLSGEEARRFVLPEQFATTPGSLVLYSLAHGRVLGSAQLGEG